MQQLRLPFVRDQRLQSVPRGSPLEMMAPRCWCWCWYHLLSRVLSSQFEHALLAVAWLLQLRRASRCVRTATKRRRCKPKRPVCESLRLASVRVYSSRARVANQLPLPLSARSATSLRYSVGCLAVPTDCTLQPDDRSQTVDCASGDMHCENLSSQVRHMQQGHSSQRDGNRGQPVSEAPTQGVDRGFFLFGLGLAAVVHAPLQHLA
jgi:hypothetical protein